MEMKAFLQLATSFSLFSALPVCGIFVPCHQISRNVLLVYFGGFLLNLTSERLKITAEYPQ